MTIKVPKFRATSFLKLASISVLLLSIFAMPFGKVFAATPRTVIWTTSGDFDNNDVVSGSATTPTQVVTTSGNVTLDSQEFMIVSAGDEYSLGIKSDGTLWAWGANNSGDLGVGDTSPRNSPTQIGTDSDWQFVSAGYYYNSFAIKSDGTLWAWGENGEGELGLGDTTVRHIPTQVGVDTNWKGVFGGDESTLGIKTDGTLWATGWNAKGQLGLGNTTEVHVFTQVGTDNDWVAVSESPAYDFTLAMKSDGTLWAWGFNSNGQLGQGDTIEQHSPTQVGTDDDWQAVSAGYTHSLAIKSDGTLWVWGSNSYGELGLGDTVERYVPTQVGAEIDWQSVVGGQDGESFALKSDRTLWVWGYNGAGELGLGDTTDRDTPTQVGTDADWSLISGGYDHSLALKSDKTLYTWGDNTYGQLGLGFTGAVTNPELTPIQQGAQGLNWQSISMGDFYSLAIRNDGTLWGWGQNGAGQLGLGDTTDRNTPTQIGTDTNWTKIVAGPSYPSGDKKAFSLAIKSDGTLWTWGQNDYGQLGQGDTTERHLPTQVGIDTHWDSVATGYFASFAIKSDGTLWATGLGGDGSLGIGDAADKNVFTQVGTDTNWSKVTSGTDEQTLAMKTDGSIWGWGYNASGELGLGDSIEKDVPTQVGSETDWTDVQAGYYLTIASKSDGTLWAAGCCYLGIGDGSTKEVFTKIGTDTDWASYSVSPGSEAPLAIKTNGTLWGWGYNADGELGLGDTTDRLAPLQIGTDTDWSTSFSGGYNGAALKQDNSFWIWGYNTEGQLGINLTVPNMVGASTWKSPSAYFNSGIITGLKLDAGSGKKGSWSSLDWTSVALPPNTSISFRVRTSDDDVSYSSWSSSFTQNIASSTTGTADISGETSTRYLEIEVTLDSSDGVSTPTLSSFTLNYDETSVSSGGGGGGPAPGTPVPPVTPIPPVTPPVTPPIDPNTPPTEPAIQPIQIPGTNLNSSSNGALVNDHRTIYLIMNGTKIGFTTWNAFIGLGYDPKLVVAGDTSNIPQSTYVLSVVNQDHPWGTFLLIGTTVYYSDESGLIGISTWNVFLSNGGSLSKLIPANNADEALPKVSQLMSVNDVRVRK